jgi:hypothetical protein
VPRRSHGRCVKSTRTRRVRSAARRIRYHVSRVAGRVRGQIGEGARGVLGHPVSRLVAPTLAVGAALTLLTEPLSNGDNWMARLNVSIDQAMSGDYSNVLQMDPYGHNLLSVAAHQIQDNAVPAIIQAAEAAVVGWLGRKVGM